MTKIIAIAIDEYSDPTIMDLQNCSKDINLLIDTLSNLYEFDTYDLYTKPEQTTLSFLYKELNNEFINALDSDNILVLFAGHGEYNPFLKTSYWQCSDSKKADVTTWFNLTDLLSFFNASPSRHIALISDSCYSGAIFEINRGGGEIALEAKLSRQALTSGGIEKVIDGDQNSPFSIALIDALKGNTSEILSFNQLSETTILTFSQKAKQTPSFGSLVNTGHEGGTFVLRRKLEGSNLIKSIRIPIGINQEVKIDYNFEIPFFNENKYFNNNYINAFVQGFGYSIINDIRLLIPKDDSSFISRSSEEYFYIHGQHSIHTLNENFLSMTIGYSMCFGEVHPQHYIYSINFAFNPERKITLFDILDYSDFLNFEDFLINMIEQFGEDECKEILKEYSTIENSSELIFYFGNGLFTIDFMNIIPHVMIACGSLEIPIDKIKLKI